MSDGAEGASLLFFFLSRVRSFPLSASCQPMMDSNSKHGKPSRRQAPCPCRQGPHRARQLPFPHRDWVWWLTLSLVADAVLVCAVLIVASRAEFQLAFISSRIATREANPPALLAAGERVGLVLSPSEPLSPSMS